MMTLSSTLKIQVPIQVFEWPHMFDVSEITNQATYVLLRLDVSKLQTIKDKLFHIHASFNTNIMSS